MSKWSMTDVLLILGAMATTALLTAKPDKPNKPKGSNEEGKSLIERANEAAQKAGFPRLW